VSRTSDITYLRYCVSHLRYYVPQILRISYLRYYAEYCAEEVQAVEHLKRASYALIAGAFIEP
jgi:hypothetical protein